MAYKKFQEIVWNYYKKNKRDLPWRRRRIVPYHVLVSEFMLQQTQVDRVVPKFTSFIKRFPNLETLARAKSATVVKEWSGLGYNRRALFLHRSAKTIVSVYDGIIPKEKELLSTLPGVGDYIASAIAAFAYNSPSVFIETNIRTVYLYHFFKGKKGITDKELFPYIQKTLNTKNPREWYFALMDYGTYLKKTVGNISVLSASYKRQPAFHGSNRKLRGLIIKYFVSQKTKVLSLSQLLKSTTQSYSKEDVQKNLKILINEGFLQEKKGGFILK